MLELLNSLPTIGQDSRKTEGRLKGEKAGFGGELHINRQTNQYQDGAQYIHRNNQYT